MFPTSLRGGASTLTPWRCLPAVAAMIAGLLLGCLPARAQCPAGAPSCSTKFDTAVTDFPMVVTDLCEDLGGAVYQALEEEPMDGFVHSLVYHPVDGRGDLLEGPHPLALLVPGNGHEYIYYEDLLTHLAAQGIVAVSLRADPTASAAQRADVLLCGLRNMVHGWSASSLSRRVALLGHSRGGEAAVMAANRLGELQAAHSVLDDGIAVRAVVGVAPAANCDGATTACLSGNAPVYTVDHANLLDESTSSLLVIQGSRDGDVPGDGLRIYEDASPEGVPPGAGDMTKAMIWVYGVAHNSWGGKSFSSAADKGAVLARAYVGSFLRWWLLGEDPFRSYFTGEDTPPCIADPAACGLEIETPEVFSQYREGGEYDGQRLRIHDFQPPQPLDPSYLGAVQDAPLGSAHLENLLTFSPPFAGHVSTEAVVMPLNTVREATLRFSTGRHRDFSAYSVLSLRLGKPVLKVPGDTEAECRHLDPQDLTVRVALTDGDDLEREVPSSDYRRVTDADIFWNPGGFGSIAGCQGKIYLTTVRIPLLEFWQAGVDPHGVREVTLRFEIAPDDGFLREVLVDSLELTINDLDPHCGNGAVEDPEVCDIFPPVGQTCLDFGFDGGSLGCSSACLPDTSGCTLAVCGDGVVEGTEECDDGNLSPYDDCNPDCTVCPPGEPLCRCLGNVEGEEDPDLPFGGVLGDGTYCSDDVLYGGLHRCVQMVGGKQACIPCTVNSGAFCPCDPHETWCTANYNEGFDSDVVSPNPPGDADMSCHFGLKDPAAPGGLDPALSDGYCFANGESESQGGAPPWFLEWYCESWISGATVFFDPALGDLCLVP